MPKHEAMENYVNEIKKVCKVYVSFKFDPFSVFKTNNYDSILFKINNFAKLVPRACSVHTGCLALRISSM